QHRHRPDRALQEPAIDCWGRNREFAMKLRIHKGAVVSLTVATAVLALAGCGERSQVPMPRADASPVAANVPAYAPSSLEGRPATAVMGAAPAQAQSTPPTQQATFTTSPPVAVDRMDD